MAAAICACDRRCTDRLSRATVKTREWKGVASRPVRPLEQIRAERTKAAE